ncbi:glucosaminidase domain-containing protein [Candidatus Saccharibacteria bacterium]|nr:glucosaminidase domain-containing protein [Candidatus Saccharibacteria bacterium]
MERIKIRIGIVAILMLLFGSYPVMALSESDMDIYSQNNILFYNPDSCEDVGGTSVYDNLVIGETRDERLKSVVESYGLLAMDLQREWGTPWEVVFAQMVIESGVGTSTSGINAGVQENGYYNWLGMTGSGGEFSVGTPYISSVGRKWAQYESIENMIKDWAGEYIARNGYYDKAFSNLSPSSFNLRGFLNDFILVYAPPSENDTSGYITQVESIINGTINDVRKEKGWPSSEELARKENIPIGGKHPLGSEGSSSSEVNSGGCAKLRSSPDYNSSDYKTKLSNLHDFNQLSGTFNNHKMCGGYSYVMKGSGCGVMSLYAGYYLFSGQGLNNEKVFGEFLDASESDGYNVCTAVSAKNFGSNLNAYTQISGEMLFNDASYTGDKWEELVSELEKGNKVEILVRKSDGSYFPQSAHYMLLDHYNKEKDMIYLFDPSMYAGKLDKLKADFGASDISYEGDAKNGLYVSRKAMDLAVKPDEALVLTYDGCYNGGADICRDTSNGLSAGGMTYEQAVKFIESYKNEAAKEKRGNYGSGYSNGNVIGKGWIADAGCFRGTLNNCVAFSQWFVNNYTSLDPGIGTTDGWGYADKLIRNGLTDGGKVPKAYAIFSTISFNHTGVVLGINVEKDEIYIGEASCSYAYPPSVHTKKLSELTNGNYKYAYTDSKLTLGNT